MTSPSLEVASTGRIDTPPGFHDGPIVVWRTWLLQPESSTGRPILTGLYGFRWFEAEMDAKCVLQDRFAGDFKPGIRKVDRYHPVIPDVHCSCGIYAGIDGLPTRKTARPPKRVPYATGFVALSGRVFIDGPNLRAQHATIVGPLTLAPGVRPLWHRASPVSRAPQHTRIATDRLHYRTIWTNRNIGEPADQWMVATAATLTERYGVGVEVLTGASVASARGERLARKEQGQ